MDLWCFGLVLTIHDLKDIVITSQKIPKVGGDWNMTCIFSYIEYIANFIILIDFHSNLFQRGWYTNHPTRNRFRLHDKIVLFCRSSLRRVGVPEQPAEDLEGLRRDATRRGGASESGTHGRELRKVSSRILGGEDWQFCHWFTVHQFLLVISWDSWRFPEPGLPLKSSSIFFGSSIPSRHPAAPRVHVRCPNACRLGLARSPCQS